jgi:hypothetical protein
MKSGKSLFAVLLIWALMFLGGLSLIWWYGTKTLPQNDELWALYDSGPNIHLNWLWKPWAEHRIPLAKLIWKVVLQLTGYDFRAGNFLTISALGATALAMIWTARKLRGRTILADAFFPLAILSFGQAQVFLWWWQVNHVLAPIVASFLLLLIVLNGNQLTVQQAALIAVALILLVTCGPGGLPYVLTFSIWLIIWGRTKWPLWERVKRERYGFVFALIAVALLLVGFYFVDYTPYFPVNDPPDISSWPPSPGPVASSAAFLQILAVSLGTATKSYSIVSGLGVLALGLGSAAILIRLWLTQPKENARTLALIAFLGAATILVIAIARSRAGMGMEYIYQGHYLPIVAPALCCVYFIWEIRGGLVGRAVQYAMVITLVALLPINFKLSVQTGKDLQQKAIAFERDVRNHWPAFVLAERHFASDVVPRTGKLTQIIREHKKNGIGLFKEVRDDPPYRVNDVTVDEAATEGILVKDGFFSASGANPENSSLTFSLPKATHVYAIRLLYGYSRTENPWPTMRVLWRNSASENFNRSTLPGSERTLFSTVAGPNQPTWALINGRIRTDAKVRYDRTLTVWVDSTIDEIRLYPDFAPCDFRLSKLELLVP